jgi:hypothetical protein
MTTSWRKARCTVPLAVVFFFVMQFSFCEAALYIDDTSTTAAGKWDIDIGTDYYKDVEKEFDPETEEYNKTICKEKYMYIAPTFGLADAWDIWGSLPYKFLDDTSDGKVNGFTDISLGTKYRLWEERKVIPSYAVTFDLKMDNANKNKGLGTGKKDYAVNNIFTKTIGKEIVDFNFGYILIGGKADDLFTYSFDITHEFTEKVSLCNEVYGEAALGIGFNKNLFCYGLSVSYQITDLLSFDSGVGVGITGNSPDYQVSNSVTFSF